MSIMLVLWVSYDVDLLAHKMEASEWTQAIVFLYTDILLLISFCAIVCVCCCLAGGGGDAGSVDAAGGAEGVDAGTSGVDAGALGGEALDAGSGLQSV